MANEQHLEIVRRGREAIHAYREEHPETRLDLSDAYLSNADLSGADLSRANARSANLGDADLSGSKLSGATLSGANLSRANLAHADLSDADLSRADLSDTYMGDAKLNDAILIRANLSGSYMSGANVNNTRFGYTLFLGTQLDGVVGLNESKHFAPSSLDADMLRHAPPEFVRDCGFPDRFVEFLPSLLADVIAFYSCFISYSSEDEEFCKRLHSKLREAGLTVWFAPDDMKSGEKIHEQIDQQIRLHDKLLVVLSEHSTKSQWVETEIYHARQREEREKKRVLFPISLCSFEQLQDWKCFDSDTGRDMAREIREYFIPDFSNWKDHDSFEESAKKLIEDLQRSEEQSPD